MEVEKSYQFREHEVFDVITLVLTKNLQNLNYNQVKDEDIRLLEMFTCLLDHIATCESLSVNRFYLFAKQGRRIDQHIHIGAYLEDCQTFSR